MALSEAEITAGLKQWQPLVRKMAWSFLGRLRELHDLDDLVAIGTIALWRALTTYNDGDASGASFATYARRCLLYAYLREAKDLRASNRKILSHSRQSLDAVHPDGRPVVESPVSGADDPEAALMKSRRDAALNSAVGKLPVRMRVVIQRRYERGVGFEEMAPQFGCSRQRLQQLETKAFRMMRPVLRGQGIGR